MDFFDSHAHYNDAKFNNNRKELLEDIYSAGVTRILNAGYDLKSSEKAIQIAEENEFIVASVGLSPHDLGSKDFVMELQGIEKLSKHEKVVAIGEIGLDYYWNKDNKELQKDVFMKQIELANKLDLPIIIHNRDASSDVIDVLKNKMPSKNKGVFHCCMLEKELVEEAIKLDYYISFAGPITFKNTHNADEIINMVPLDRIVIETDSPYLSPEPYRGRTNDSRNLKYIAEKIAEARNMSIEEIAETTSINAKKLFRT